VAPGDQEASERNEQLVEQLVSSGTLRDPAVVAAFRAVLRHWFLPDRPLDEVYEDSAIMTKIGERGLPVSSSSQPAIMAIMLQLLELRPGHRVLEIGAGTGYNAALIAWLVGRDGAVVSVEIDPELADRARANLAAAGVERVEVVRGDGAEGWAPEAPYERLIVTAGADDLAPAWVEQLTDRGRLVLPLGLAGPSQQCVALVRRGPSLAGHQLCPCGFMPLRGSMAPTAGVPDDELAGWLAAGGRPTGDVIPFADIRAGFEAWLALTADHYVRPRTSPEEPLVFGLRDERGCALAVGDGDQRSIVAFGDGAAAAAELVRAHRAWASERPGLSRLRVDAHPAGAEPPLQTDVRVVRRPRFTFVVSSA
jgi:protein-L-isoaspartate(D-aspartate) O-methyltransferase